MAASKPSHLSGEAMEVSVEAGNRGDEERLDDDGRPRRTGTMWTASAHIITAVIGAGVLSLAWAMAQLGWGPGLVAMVVFAAISYYTSTLLANCYRSGDPVAGKRNYTYTEAVPPSSAAPRSSSAASSSTPTSSASPSDTPSPPPSACWRSRGRIASTTKGTRIRAGARATPT
jgi:hypothetical protein